MMEKNFTAIAVVKDDAGCATYKNDFNDEVSALSSMDSFIADWPSSGGKIKRAQVLVDNRGGRNAKVIELILKGLIEKL